MVSTTHDGTQGAPFGIYVTLVVLVGLVVSSFFIGLGLLNRVGDLERELVISADGLGTVDSQVVDALLELRVLSYWLAYPTTEPLVLEPPNGIGNSQGVLRLAADGLSGILIVASMGQNLPPTYVYQVWLEKEGQQQLRVAQFKVDTKGWGATTFYLGEAFTEFDSVVVTADKQFNPQGEIGTKLLEASIDS